MKKVLYLLSFLVLSINIVSAYTDDPSLSLYSRDESTGGAVTRLQNILKSTVCPSLTITGFFGLKTVECVKAFQKSKSLPSTGYVGPMTKVAIKNLNLSNVLVIDAATVPKIKAAAAGSIASSWVWKDLTTQSFDMTPEYKWVAFSLNTITCSASETVIACSKRFGVKNVELLNPDGQTVATVFTFDDSKFDVTKPVSNYYESKSLNIGGNSYNVQNHGDNNINYKSNGLTFNRVSFYNNIRKSSDLDSIFVLANLSAYNEASNTYPITSASFGVQLVRALESDPSLSSARNKAINEFYCSYFTSPSKSIKFRVNATDGSSQTLTVNLTGALSCANSPTTPLAVTPPGTTIVPPVSGLTGYVEYPRLPGVGIWEDAFMSPVIQENRADGIKFSAMINANWAPRCSPAAGVTAVRGTSCDNNINALCSTTSNIPSENDKIMQCRTNPTYAGTFYTINSSGNKVVAADTPFVLDQYAPTFVTMGTCTKNYVSNFVGVFSIANANGPCPEKFIKNLAGLGRTVLYAGGWSYNFKTEGETKDIWLAGANTESSPKLECKYSSADVSATGVAGSYILSTFAAGSSRTPTKVVNNITHYLQSGDAAPSIFYVAPVPYYAAWTVNSCTP